MTQKRTKDILFYIENEVQFSSLEPLLTYLRDNTSISFDIVVPDATSQGAVGSKKMYDACAGLVSSRGFELTRSIDDVVLPESIVDTRYKVMMAAYIFHWQRQNVRAKYFIMFPYASYYLNKPNWTIPRFMELDYMADALLSHAIGTKDITDIYTKTYIVPSLKLMNFRKKTAKREKPVLFFAPTYNEIEFAVRFLESIEDIKKAYKVAMRGHPKEHREGNSPIEHLYGCADEVYDPQEYSLVEAMEKSDLVVSDNSATIFDAIYCGMPVAIFSRDPNSLRYNEINTAQSELIKDGNILWTDEPDKIVDIANQTLRPDMIKRQDAMRKELFPLKKADPVKEWMSVINLYLNDKIPYGYHLAKQYWIDSIGSRPATDGESDVLRERSDTGGVDGEIGVRRATTLLMRAIWLRCIEEPKVFLRKRLRLPYRKLRIKLFKDPIVIYEFVFTEPHSINFGDELTSDIIERLFNRNVEVHNEIDTKFDMLGVGSLIHFFNDITNYRTYVWGSGLIDDSISSVNNNFIFKACRGRSTLSKLSRRYQNIPLGDPGLLCNLIYKNEVKKTDKIGVIPHLRDWDSHFLNDIIKKHPDIFQVISVAQTPEDVADQIKSCRLILSSSLHGLIVSDSFGIPNIHLRLSDNLKSPNHLRGGEYKFRDYYSGVDREYKNFDPRYRSLLDLEGYERIIKDYRPIKDLEKIQRNLIKSFPYR